MKTLTTQEGTILNLTEDKDEILEGVEYDSLFPATFEAGGMSFICHNFLHLQRAIVASFQDDCPDTLYNLAENLNLARDFDICTDQLFLIPITFADTPDGITEDDFFSNGVVSWDHYSVMQQDSVGRYFLNPIKTWVATHNQVVEQHRLFWKEGAQDENF